MDVKHEVKIELDEKIDPTTICTEGLLIQPFVENAIKHGINTISKACQILIKVSNLENELHCVVQDNGRGRDKKLIHLNSVCSGITITQERLQYLHNHFRTRYVFQMNDLVDQNGPQQVQVFSLRFHFSCRRMSVWRTGAFKIYSDSYWVKTNNVCVGKSALKQPGDIMLT